MSSTVAEGEDFKRTANPTDDSAGVRVMAVLRMATFNLDNFDETAVGVRPSLNERIGLMRPQIQRLRADCACFPEVHGPERPGQPRAAASSAAALYQARMRQ